MDTQEVMRRARTKLQIHMGDYVSVAASPHVVVVKHIHQRTATDADYMFSKVELEPHGRGEEKVLSHADSANYAVFGTHGNARSELFFFAHPHESLIVNDDRLQAGLTRYRLEKVKAYGGKKIEDELINCARYLRHSSMTADERHNLVTGKRLVDNIARICYDRNLRIVCRPEFIEISEIDLL